MAALIDFPAPTVNYDRRATHRVISDVSAFDRIMDADADAQEAIIHLERAHFLALGTGNEPLVRELTVVGSKIVHIRRLCHEGTQLLNDSVVVDPFRAVQFGSIGPDAA